LQIRKSNLHELPSSVKRLGADWFALFNKNIRTNLDISLLRSIRLGVSCVSCVCFSGDGQYLAAANGVAITLFNTCSGTEVGSVVEKAKARSPYQWVCFCQNSGNDILTGGETEVITLWNINLQPVKTFISHELGIVSLQVPRVGALFASLVKDGTVRLWDTKSGQSLLTIKVADHLDSRLQSRGMAISPNGRLIAAVSFNPRDTNYYACLICLWNTNGSLLKTFNPEFASLAFAPNGEELLTVSASQKSIKIWQLKDKPMSIRRRVDGGQRQSVSTPGVTYLGSSRFVAYNSSGYVFAIAYSDGQVGFWSAGGIRLLRLFEHKKSGHFPDEERL
jgi:WD40 repeat protein